MNAAPSLRHFPLKIPSPKPKRFYVSCDLLCKRRGKTFFAPTRYYYDIVNFFHCYFHAIEALLNTMWQDGALRVSVRMTIIQA